MQMSSKIWVKVQGVGVSWVNIYGAVCEPLFSSWSPDNVWVRSGK